MLLKPLETATETALRSLIAGLSPDVLPESADASSLKEARRLCREGNPFPLIAIQWPELIITDQGEAKYFDGAIGDPLNPALRLDWWQRMILMAYFDPVIKEIYIKGCTGAGKGGSAGIGINLYFDVYAESRGHCTGPTFTHSVENIFGEVSAWRKRMRNPYPATENTTSITEHQQHYITVLNPQRGQGGETFSGKHSKFTYYVFDEATSAESTWLENAAKNAKKIICLANPRTVIGHFRSAFQPLGKEENKNGVCNGVLGRRLCVTVSGLHCANVKHGRLKDPVAPLDGIEIDGTHYPEHAPIPPEAHEKVKPLIPGQIDLQQYRSIVKKSGEAWKVRCFAHGMFPDEDPQAQIYLISSLRRHAEAHTRAGATGCPVNAFGLDVARSLEGDDTCLAAGSSVGCREFFRFKLPTYTQVAEELLKICSERYGIDLTRGGNPVCIDYGGGYGAGVGDWLAKAGVWIVANVPAGRAKVTPEWYMNERTELHALLGRRLSNEDIWADTPWFLPDDEKLLEEMLLTVREWSPDFTRFRVVPKEFIKECLPDKRSPDRADSVALLFQAVREMDGMNEYFAMTSGDMAMWPRRPTETTTATAPQAAESKGGFDWAQAGGSSAKQSKPPVANPQQALGDLLEWMKARRQR